MSFSHEQWIEKVIDIADQNVEKGGGPFAAIIVRDGEVISSGVNEVHIESDPTAHAELLAVREACMKLGTTDLSEYTLYASGEPCPMCMGAIYWANLKAIYYACSKDEAAQAVNFPDPLKSFYHEMNTSENRSIPIIKIDAPHRIKPFQTWKKLN